MDNEYKMELIINLQEINDSLKIISRNLTDLNIRDKKSKGTSE